MLVNCPKCGFSQPKDRYCASCGVDMENFRPVTPSFFSQLISHPAVHIFLIFVTVFAAVYFIRSRHHQQEATDQMERKGPSFVATANNSSGPSGAPTATATNPTSAIPRPTEAMPQPVGTATPAATASPTASVAPARPAGNPIRVKVVLAEVEDLTLKNWASEMQAAGSYSDDDWKMGSLPKLEKRMGEDRSIVSYETSQKTIDSAHPSQDWFMGKSADGTDWGFHFNTTLTESDQQIHGDFHIIRQVESSDPKTEDLEIEMPSKSGWVIWHALSPKSDAPKEFFEDPKSFFQVFKSNRFKNKYSDFTIFLMFDTDSNP